MPSRASSPSSHFFLDCMLTRLRLASHSEIIRPGLDLVALMIKLGLAARHSTPFDLSSQEQYRAPSAGFGIEARVYTEMPHKAFKPAPGLLTEVAFPSNDWLRVDTWVQTGTLVSPFFGAPAASPARLVLPLCDRETDALVPSRPHGRQDHRSRRLARAGPIEAVRRALPDVAQGHVHKYRVPQDDRQLPRCVVVSTSLHCSFCCLLTSVFYLLSVLRVSRGRRHDLVPRHLRLLVPLHRGRRVRPGDVGPRRQASAQGRRHPIRRPDGRARLQGGQPARRQRRGRRGARVYDDVGPLSH